jgi:dTDP-4-amino-4,6-dideoxygalactose transaminase
VRVPFIDLSRQVAGMRVQLESAFGRTLDGGRFVFGPLVEEFEQAFAGYCGVAHGIGVASGTDAIAIALRAVGIGAGDEVVTAANTCVPTVAGIEAAGATPILADVDTTTYTLDPASVEAALTERTRAVVPVHLYGQCADMQPLLELARTYDLKVVEDAAQAHGAEYAGQRAGALGDAAAFSFYATKNLGALGDAGMVVTNDSDVAARARLVRNYGEEERYRSVLSGTNSRLDALQAAILSEKLQRLDEWNERRRELADAYREQLGGSVLELPEEAAGRRHVFHLFVVRVPDRDRFRTTLDGAGVTTLVHYPRAVHEHPGYAHLRKDGLERSERLCREVVSLPLYPELTDDEVAAVAAAAHALG